MSCQWPANSSGTMASSRARSTSSRFDHVDQIGEVGGKIRGLSGRHVDDRGRGDAALGHRLEPKQVPEGEHELHQRQPSRQRADRGFAERAILSETLFGPEDDGRVLIGIAERSDARQKQSLALRLRQERLAQRPCGAARGQIDGGERQSERIGRESTGRRQVAGENGLRQRGEERR